MKKQGMKQLQILFFSSSSQTNQFQNQSNKINFKTRPTLETIWGNH